MKTAILSALAILSFGFSASASEKVCTGLARTEVAGVVLKLNIDAQKLVVKSAKGDWFDGTYNSNGGKKTEAGKVYVQYEGYDDGYFNTFSVDRNLLEYNTTGVVKVRFQGEGEDTVVFNCGEGI